MPIEDFIVPGIGAAFNIVDGAISRGQALRDFERNRKLFEQDREYNSPANQIKRLHEAGLPSAAFFSGGASQQSDIFSDNVAPTDSGLGAAGEHIGKFFSTRMQRIETETAQTNLEILKNQKKLSDLEVQDQLEKVPVPEFQQNAEGEMEETFTMMPRVIKNKRQQERMEDSKELAMSLEASLKSIEHQIRNATSQKEIDIVKAKLDNILEDTLNKSKDTFKKDTENKYLKNELDYKLTLRQLRQEFWGKLRTGEMPNFREILNILMLALENRL